MHKNFRCHLVCDWIRDTNHAFAVRGRIHLRFPFPRLIVFLSRMCSELTLCTHGSLAHSVRNSGPRPPRLNFCWAPIEVVPGGGDAGAQPRRAKLYPVAGAHYRLLWKGVGASIAVGARGCHRTRGRCSV